MKKLIFLFVLMWFSFNAAKGVDPSCLFNANNLGAIHFYSFLDSINIDIIRTTEVFIDTCGLTDFHGKPFNKDTNFVDYYNDNAIYEKRFYTNEMYRIHFPYFPFDTTGYDMDTVTYFTVNDIKQELREIKDSLLSLSSLTGEIRFYETNQKFKIFTNTSLYAYGYCASFEKMVNAYETEEKINNFKIGNFKCEFASYFVYVVGSVYEKNENIKLYPNPANDAVFMDISEHFNALKVTNANGEVVKEFTLEEIRNFNANQKIAFKVSEFNTGVYFIIIDNKYVEKLVIAR
ncbi:MAG: T9SS type A sorting domain-containing protein [Ignavibacteria bacterium]|nr:T9SS type A sorting domain-containing protein [Ignavibacteria bacterium]